MTSQIFGVIVAGRLAGETEFVCEIQNAKGINHLVVFLTGVQPFGDGLGGSVYVRWPDATGEVNWHYLGFIANQKPSAIFKVAQLHRTASNHGLGLFASHDCSPMGTEGSALIGVMVEPLGQIESRVAAAGTSTNQQSTIAQFSEKMLNNLVNHLSSFVVQLPRPENPTQLGEFVPIRAVNDWYNNFTRRFQQNPNFLKSL